MTTLALLSGLVLLCIYGTCVVRALANNRQARADEERLLAAIRRDVGDRR